MSLPKRITAPLLSGLVLPGLGQLINRQLGKGALLICLMSLFFMSFLFLTVYQVSQAMSALGEAAAQSADKWQLLRAQLARQGTGWLWGLGITGLGIWLFAVIDAARVGARLDRSAAEGGQGKS